MAKTTEISDNLTKDQAKIVLQFLQRTNLQGSEMPAYVDVFNVLTSLAGLSGKTGQAGASD